MGNVDLRIKKKKGNKTKRRETREKIKETSAKLIKKGN